MTVCDTCGNDYDHAFTVTRGDQSWVFDSFECAITLAAPRCAHCDCLILGHGVEAGAAVFCCSHCARQEGHTHATDDKDADVKD